VPPSDESHDQFHAPEPAPAGLEREKFASREIAQVLSHYDLGVIREIREYRRGSRRSPKLRLETERGQFLLKRKVRGYSADHARTVHELQRLAAQARVPVAPIVPLRGGGTLLEFGGHLYELFTWVDGRRYERDPAQAREAGVALARLHRAFDAVGSPGRLPAGGFSDIDAVRRSLRLAEAAALRSSDSTAHAELQALVASLDHQEARVGKKLAEKGLGGQLSCPCHGDFHPGNTLWSGVSLAAVIDFDSARHESVAAEVANAALQFSIKHRVGNDPDAWQVGLDPDRLRAFIEGYASQPEVAVREDIAQLLPWLMISAVIAEAAVPIARDGTFAEIPALPFLRTTSRLVDWIAQRTRAIAGLFPT
jgi:Ser/Thr protein kinase RdoA (MazF antagonist)